MGGRESKQSVISYEDAIKRVSESELRRLLDAFKKSAGIGKMHLSRNAFQYHVLYEGIPPKVADMLYTACGGTNKGITFRDLFCGLVLFTRGTNDEKLRFLWNLFCNDTENYIQKLDFIRSVDLNHVDSSNSLFDQGDHVNFEQFQEWILEHKNSSILSGWLLSEPCINLTSELESPTFYQSLAGVTHLEERDIGDLEKEFWSLKNSSPNTQLDLQLLGPLISPPIPKAALIGLFNAFDENRDGHIDFKELCCGVSAACRGPEVERTRFCFKIFDIDRDGILNYTEIVQMISVLTFVAKESRNAHLYKDIEKETALLDLFSFNARKKNSNDNVNENNSLDEENEKISLTVEDFMMWSVESNTNLVQPFLDLTFELCHIVFGLWPQCQHLEHNIVCGWLKREKKRNYRVGQFWYLISHDWWISWLQYTQNSDTYCECYKKLPSSTRICGEIDEALVCDETLNSNSLEIVSECGTNANNLSEGSRYNDNSTGKSLRVGRPGPIDNLNLIRRNPHKVLRTLTGEGGHLRRDTPLSENHDFKLVPKSLWKALNRWYGDKLPLPRQVIKAPNSSEMELELYPINLRIVLHQSAAYVTSLNSFGTVSGSYSIVASGGSFATLSATNSPPPLKRYVAYQAAFSRLATVHQICEFLCIQLRLRIEDVRVWHIPIESLENSAILLEEDNMTLEDLLIKDNDQVLFEIRNKDLTWPEELGSLSLNQSGGISVGDHHYSRASITPVHAPGATGLHNLGNTCFLNAALQVLFNTQPLAQYFRLNMHLFELNTNNKLGTKGQLALRYGELLKEMWNSTSRSVAPLKLRFCVVKHAPQFAGGGQHDSQELLEWFLDALHEDLNRVTEKPYSELKDSNGRPDKVVALEAWTQHHARNQSVIIDLFYGQLKSKVSCLGCGGESVRFDPFSLLSLPLPVENYVYFEVLVVLLDGSVPIKYGLRLNPESKYIDLKNKLSTLCFLKPSFMLVCEVYNSQIKLILYDNEKINSATAKELYVYELPEECSDRSRSSSMNIEKGLKDIQRSSALMSGSESITSFTTAPMIQIQSSHILDSNNAAESEESVCSSLRSIDKNKKGSINQTIGDEDMYSTKVRRCFGNTMCMPQNLLCFKQSLETGRSPENTFTGGYQKRISSTKLLSTENYVKSSPFMNPIERDTKDSSSPSQILYSNFLVCNNSDCLDEKCFCEMNVSKPAKSNCFNKSDEADDDKNVLPFHVEPKFLDNSLETKTRSIPSINQAINISESTNNSYFFRRMNSEQYKLGKYIIAVHRKIIRQDTYFLSHHKTRPSLFGVPIIVPNIENGTHKDLYCSVWMQVNRLLSPLPASTEQANHAADCDDSLGYDFPFTLRAVKNDGLTCAVCPWSNFCRGCEIPCNDDYLSKGIHRWPTRTWNSPCSGSNDSNEKLLYTENDNLHDNNSDYSYNFIIAIDWDPTALHLRYQSSLERLYKEDESVSSCRLEQIEPVDLNHCLRAFTSEEKLEEWYHCGHCKGKKPATKKLQIWKLPPILIVHLKRFNCVNGKWVKSQKVVHFPFDDFDPTPYLASVPQETILRHRELREICETSSLGGENHHKLTDIGEIDNSSLQLNQNSHKEDDRSDKHGYDDELSNSEHDSTDSDSMSNSMNYNNCVQHDDYCNAVIVNSDNIISKKNKVEANDRNIPPLLSSPIIDNTTKLQNPNKIKTRKQVSVRKKRKRLISTSLVKTPIIDGQFEDFHQHKLRKGEDKFDPKYKLYAVVCHSGMLSGGHYISYAANQNGTWYCFNDSSCREIPSKPNIDPSSAYLLFYERNGLDYEPYLPNVDDKVLPNGSLEAGSDDGSNDLKKLCNIV